MHDVQRIAGLPHVQTRQRTPGAADRIKGPALAALEHCKTGQGFLDDLFRLLQRFRGNIGERQTAQRTREAIACASAANVDQLKRTAAEIAHDAIAAVHAGNDAERRKLGLTGT